jgi:deoxyribose-phosphate aldolase
MRKILPDEMKIKFSGGIRSLSQIKELSPFIDRVGTSSIIN